MTEIFSSKDSSEFSSGFSSRDVLRQSLITYKSLFYQVVYITVFAIALPQLAFKSFALQESISAVSFMQQWVAANAESPPEGAVGPDFRELLPVLTNFSGMYFLMTLALGVLGIAAIFALIELALAVQNGQVVGKNPGMALKSFWRGLGWTVPRGLLVAGFLIFLTFASQLIFPPLLILAVFLAMAPTLMVAEKSSVFAAMKNALTIRYARYTNLGTWTIASFLMFAGLIFYSFTIGWMLFIAWFRGRDFWFYQLTQTLAQTPVATPVFIVDTIEVIGFIAIISFLPPIAVSLYNRCKP